MSPVESASIEKRVIDEVRTRQEKGEKVVFTNGCFDILHVGHVRYLQGARDLGDFLIVGLNSDASVKRLKGESRPIVNEADRIQDIVEQQKGFIGGEFRLGIIPTIMPTLLPMFLKNFIKKHPKIRLIIEELNTADIISKLNNGHLDAAIAATPRRSKMASRSAP